MSAVVRQTLGNGVRAIVAPLPHLHRACICALINVGARDEQPHNNGISHFVEHMIFRGNSRYRSPYHLNSAVEAIGGDLYAATHTDFTHYQITLPAANFHAGMEILGQTLREPTFDNIDVERQIVRQEILGSLDERGQDIDVSNLSRELLFAPHPLSFPIAGSLQTLDTFSREDLLHHHARYYCGTNTVICLTGAIDVNAALGSLEEHFSGLPSGALCQRNLLPPDWRGGLWKYLPYDDSQSDLRICFDCPGETDTRVLALQLLSRILDDGMSTRLHRVLCEQKGLAYEVFGGLELFQECGVYDIGISVEQSRVPAVLAAVIELIRDLRQDGLQPGELDKVKKRFLWDLESSIDYAEETAFFLSTRTLMGKTDSIDQLIKDVAKVTQQDVEELIQCIFLRNNLHAACIGKLSAASESQAVEMLQGF
jgi:predicted Zn-dependent peptidase